jgi:hypothetical protein
MGIIEQEIDREAHLVMRSYADVQAEILKNLDPNQLSASAAAIVTSIEQTDIAEADESHFLVEYPLPISDRFQWGVCVVCVDVCHSTTGMLSATLSSEFSRQQAQSAAASVDITAIVHNSTTDGIDKIRPDEDIVALPVKSTPSSGTSLDALVASLSGNADGGESQQNQPTSTTGAGASMIARDIVASAAVVSTLPRGDIDTPKIQVLEM